MTIFWTRRAVGHLASLRDYIAQDSPRAAARVASRVLDATQLLSVQPHIGRPGRILGTRELIVSGTPYVIPYRVRQDRLEILAIMHGRQRWPEQL